MSSVNDAGVTRTYGYDARGNVTNNGKHSFYYDLSDQPTGVSGVGSYLYDGNQKRVRLIITENNVTKTTYSVYGLGGQLLYTDKVTENKKTDYIRAAGQTIARIENTTVKYPHNDLLGSPVSATTSTGAVEWREQYTPYGEKRIDPTQNKDNVGFTGHVQDDITGLTYMQARYYDPAIGRFLSIDPVGFTPNNPMSFNRYAYANNNPYLYTDPTGRNPAIDRRLANLGSLSTGDLKAIGNVVADFTPVVGDIKGFVEAAQNPTVVGVTAAVVGVVPVVGDIAGKSIKAGGQILKNGDKLATDDALKAAVDFLGDKPNEIANGVFKSADGKNMVRMTDSDLAKQGNHAGGPHMNFEQGNTVVKPNGKETFESDTNVHIFLPEEK